MGEIVLLDPSLMNHAGDLSINLGDVIIYDSVKKILNELFPKEDIIRIASHAPLEKQHFDLIKNSKFTFVGGTNIFTSDIVNGFAQLPIKYDKRRRWIFPGIKNIIFLGAGWGVGYNLPISLRTKIFYKIIMNSRILHSARDSYSAKKMSKLANIINTSCPTAWDLNGININRKKIESICLLTLTDYNQNKYHDSKLLELCLANFSKIVFFPQGQWDMDYLNSLDIFKGNKDRFVILPHDIYVYFDFVDNENYTYVGTRLHGGIRCLQAGRSAAIIGIDNRALEMSRDIGLPVIARDDLSLLEQWLTMRKFLEI